jgi:hypothetical protein
LTIELSYSIDIKEIRFCQLLYINSQLHGRAVDYGFLKVEIANPPPISKLYG